MSYHTPTAAYDTLFPGSRTVRALQRQVNFWKVRDMTHFLEISEFYPAKSGVLQNSLSTSPEPRKRNLFIVYQWVNAIKQRNKRSLANGKTAQKPYKYLALKLLYIHCLCLWRRWDLRVQNQASQAYTPLDPLHVSLHPSSHLSGLMVSIHQPAFFGGCWVAKRVVAGLRDLNKGANNFFVAARVGVKLLQAID
mgnify:CR=1 FL=1